MSDEQQIFEGGCTCRQVRYRLMSKPMFVHCCHCRWWQRVSRCPTCRVAVWSNYAGAGDSTRFVRVGTLDEPQRLPPDIHIFTSTRQPWLTLGSEVPVVPEYYKSSQIWPAESLARRAALMAKKP